MLYKGDKDVNDAARPAESGPAEAGSFTASSLPLLDSARSRQSQHQFNPVDRDAASTSSWALLQIYVHLHHIGESLKCGTNSKNIPKKVSARQDI